MPIFKGSQRYSYCVSPFARRSPISEGTTLYSSQKLWPWCTLLAMSADSRNGRALGLIQGGSQRGKSELSSRFSRPLRLRKRTGCEQVAAVCYRVQGRSIAFLLVQTRGGRWTFPKGNTEPGLTQAQAAALEAFEEAGIHGRMEETSFARYVRRKRRDAHTAGAIELAVNAHLCEVLELGPAQESNRNRTWFSAEKAKRRLREGRALDYGAELARVVDRALYRIQRLRSAASVPDGLQRVQFEGFERSRVSDQMEVSFSRYKGHHGEMRYSSGTAAALNDYVLTRLGLSVAQEPDRRPIWSGADGTKRRLPERCASGYEILPASVVEIGEPQETTIGAKVSENGRKNRRRTSSS